MPETVQLPAWLTVVLLGVAALMLIAVARGLWRLARGVPVLPRRPRRAVPWNTEGAFLAGFFLMIATFQLLALLVADLSADRQTAEQGLSLSQVLQHGVMVLLFAFGPFGWMVMFHPTRRPVRLVDLGMKGSPSDWLKDMQRGVLCLAGILPVVYGVNYLLVAIFGEPTYHPAIESLLSSPNAETIAAAALMAVVLAPLFEELAFRVLLQGWLEKRFPRESWTPIVISAVVFGIVHTSQGYAFVSIIVLALGLGYVYRQTHSYPAVVVMHAAFNALSLAVAIGAGQLQNP